MADLIKGDLIRHENYGIDRVSERGGRKYLKMEPAKSGAGVTREEI